jgi:hypothetical protein
MKQLLPKKSNNDQVKRKVGVQGNYPRNIYEVNALNKLNIKEFFKDKQSF